ncbi:rRNA pseudouridine synthase [Candidatus Woesearchaeota archaeon]|nr:rRNA pseudouridine synthase [Candidatus Woesearchaeota archaeon]
MQRIQKLISNSGYCSRRKAEELIRQGKVRVNGKLALLGSSAEETDAITIDGKPLRREKKVYLLLNKPRGCVTAVEDADSKTVMSYVRVKERVFPVGRLDFNTTGALLLTNDGDFANRIMHPRYELKKTYLVEIDKPITYAMVREMEKGIPLTDGMTAPARVRSLEPILIEITLHEGRNHIIKRMFEHFGYRVRSLTRVKIGKVSLGSLRSGRFRHLTEKELEMLGVNERKKRDDV